MAFHVEFPWLGDMAQACQKQRLRSFKPGAVVCLRAPGKSGYHSAIITPHGLVAQSVEQRIENPCVGGSIPPRATKNIPHETPTITGWRFCLWISQSSCPVYFRYPAVVKRDKRAVTPLLLTTGVQEDCKISIDRVSPHAKAMEAHNSAWASRDYADADDRPLPDIAIEIDNEFAHHIARRIAPMTMMH